MFLKDITIAFDLRFLRNIVKINFLFFMLCPALIKECFSLNQVILCAKKLKNKALEIKEVLDSLDRFEGCEPISTEEECVISRVYI